jgi:hypothetical protein
MAGGERPREVHVTDGLLAVLLERAEAAEPESVNIVLGATPAGEFDDGLDLPAETPVLTHFYLPDVGRSVRSVFGVDLGTPAGRGRARFVTHPQGPLALTRRDDLAAVVLVAVPPWERGNLDAFDRNGRVLELGVVDAEPPQERLA